MKRKATIAAVSLAWLVAVAAFGQATNQVTVVSPNSAAQGTTGLTVTFTLDTDVPPPPPADVLPTSVTIGSLSGTSLAHPSQNTVTAVFSIPAGEAVGAKDVTVAFSAPAPTFLKAAGFTVTAGSGVVAGFTGSPTSGAPPLTVTFTNTSTGTITNQLWNFGDGTTSMDLNPAHTYTNVGSYTVSLTVFGAGGSNILTRAGYITVAEPPPDGAYVVVDTGQTNCYDATSVITPPSSGQPWYGQDAQFAGKQPNYTLSGDGKTVYDNNTGLTWQQSPNTNGYGSTITYSNKMTYSQSLLWPATLNAMNYGGYSDWRLPTIKELYSLIDFGRGVDGDANSLTGRVPFLNTNYFGFAYGFTNSPADNTGSNERVIDSQWVTTALYVANTNQMFGVNFADGRIKAYPADDSVGKKFFVLCVRGSTSYGVNNFTNNGDGTVTDRATGLMWSQADCGPQRTVSSTNLPDSGLTWSNALAWVQAKNAANYLGHSDWRLPNVKELQSILDYTRSPDTTSSAAINAIFSCSQITNEAGNLDYPWYWASTTHVDMQDDREANYICFGRSLGYLGSSWTDIHGAGAQRCASKIGDYTGYTQKDHGYYNSNAPQGDSIRLYNYVRLVRDADIAAPTLTAAVSRKAHGSAGTFDLALNLSGTSTIEPRQGGPTQIVLTFSEPVVAADGTLSANEFTISNATFSSASTSGSNLTLNLTSVVDQSTVGITLNGLTDAAGNALGGDRDVAVRALYGDCNQSGSVSVSDLQYVKNRLLQALSTSNFLADLNLSGSISVSDLQAVKNNLLHSASASSASSPSAGALVVSGVSSSVVQSPRFQFTSASQNVPETDLTASVAVTRAGDASESASINYVTFDGTAIGGLDYLYTGGTLSFGPSETNKFIAVPILPDVLTEGPETFSLQLVDPRNGSLLGTPSIVVITISDVPLFP